LATLRSECNVVHCKFVKAHGRTGERANPEAFPSETHTLTETGQLLPGRGA